MSWSRAARSSAAFIVAPLTTVHATWHFRRLALEASGPAPGGGDRPMRAPAARARRSRRRPLVPGECEILLWTGYVKSRLYARFMTATGQVIVVAESPTFRLRGHDAEHPPDAARAAHAAVVEQLRLDGWEIVDAGPSWYDMRLRRLSDD